uniref:Reverse transcriptase domain-containing protein n=1 Tax=Fagus sylvatica TaxID=28930 RepID=A0A2N9GYK3_FAGSY
MEEIDGLWKRFSLKDQEDDKFDLSSMAQQDKPTLAAKFFTRRTINIEAVARTFKPLWQTKNNFSLQDVGDNMVLVEFEDRSDLERVLIGEPWSYDKYLIAFQRVGDGREVEDLLFNRVDFWVQIHNLPILCMKKSVAERLGRSIGEVVRTQVQDEDTGNGRCMRVRVKVDITKPLNRGRKIGLANGGEGWVSFKYERLPNFCYWCGIPTHGERDCEEWLKTTDEEKDKDPEYGVWLRASQDRVLRRVQVTVEGRSRSTSKPMGGEQAVPPSPQAPTKPAVVHSPPTELDPTDMETTEYLGGINKATDFAAQNSATFEDQLRAIDMALNYTSVIPEKSGTTGSKQSKGPDEWIGPGSPILIHKKASTSAKDTRSPLGEITNKVAASTHKPNVGTWKKMARAKGQGTHDTRKFSVAEKRACDEVVQVEEEELRSQKTARVLENDFLSAAAGTVQELANMVRVKDPSAIFVMETWSHEEYLEKVTIKSYSSSHIDAIIKEGSEDAWRLTGIYGAPEAQRREETWALLRHLDSKFQLPWCCIGDFNEILKLEEMKGRFARPDRQMRGFRSALDDCGLVDLRYRGFPFTWCNNRDPPFTTWVRLDRAVANMEWLHRFPMAQVEHIDVSKSDHKCLWLSCLPPVVTRSKRRPFRFEEIWMTDGGCEETIMKAWEMSKPGTRMFKVWHKLKECKKQLGEWSRKSFGNIKKQIEILQQRIKQAESLAIQDRVHANINGLRKELNLLLGKEEKFWRQRSRTSWLAQGDRNTKYFHGRATQRRRRNSVSKLCDERGRWHESNEEIAELMIEYYTTLFTTSNPTHLAEATSEVQKVVTLEMNNNLTREFKAEEVEQAIQQMAPSKAPGPDGRLITDNVLVAFETLHHMHHNKIGREGAMAMKLDMSKAYDRVEWSYLEQIMKKMGFHQKWIGLMTECISSVSYSILINGEPHGNIHPSRGLRQGDPLSPYLFLLCAEDDSLLFAKATTTACEKIQSMLGQYEKASGQQVNRDKTTIFFSKAVPIPTQNAIKESLNVPVIRQYEKYLGLPSLIGRKRAESFTQIKERVWHKLKGWKEKLLSQAGREELEAMIRRFWWSNNSDQQKVNWVSWRKLCEPKNMGGMGFRDLQKFNEALLAKQVWRLMHDTSSLFYRVFKAKFFPNCSILEADPKIRGSYAWQSIMKSRELLIKGGVWRVGDGRRIKIWKNRWLLEDNHRTIITHGPQLLQDCTVDQLIIKPKMEWDTTLIDKLFLPYDAEAIKSIPLSERAPPDRFYWPGTAHGLYTVRSGYQALLHNEKQQLPGSSTTDALQPIWKAVWSLRIPKKCQLFVWRASREALPTRVNLCKRHIPINPKCENCRKCPEDVLHAVWSCPVLTPVWDKEPWIHSLRATPIMDFADLFSKVLDIGTYQNTEAFSIICWSLWQRRNKQRLHQEVEAIDQVSTRARAYLDEFVSSIEPLQPAEPTPTLVIKWQPPSRHNFKINYDGAVFKETNEAGIGVVVRNKAGHVMASLVQKVRYPQSVENIEAWAAKRAVQFVSEIGLKEAEFEGDSKTIVAALNDPHHCPTHYGLLIADAKSLAHALDSYCFTHVKRQGNGLAHALARMAKHTDILEVWMEDVPPPLQQLYLSDFPIQ